MFKTSCLKHRHPCSEPMNGFDSLEFVRGVVIKRRLTQPSIPIDEDGELALPLSCIVLLLQVVANYCIRMCPY